MTMKHFFYNIIKVTLPILCILSVSSRGNAQMVGDNVFMKGNYIEVGIGKNHQFGTKGDTPEGYHERTGGAGGYANSLGFVSEPALDGWDVGAPSYVGDYFLPGHPQEGWDMAIDGTWIRGFTEDYTGSPEPKMRVGLTGTYYTTCENVDYYTEGSRKIAVWQAQLVDYGLELEAITSFDTNQVFFVIDMKVKNVSGATVENIFYSRTLDPDQESTFWEEGLSSTSTTTNVIEYQPNTETGDYRALVSGTGTLYPELCYLGLGAVDCRAKVYIYPYSLTPGHPPSQIDSNGSYQTDSGWTNTSDCAIGIRFDLGDLEPGDSTMFTYTYVLSADDLDTAFGSLAGGWNIEGEHLTTDGDTAEYIVCRTKYDSLDIEIAGGAAFVWGEWEASSGGVSYPAGRSNRIGMPGSTTTYRVIGTTLTCPITDTVYLTITPVGDTTFLTEAICAGSTFDFDGTIIYETGVYYKVYTSALMGCDSVTRLTLNVNPLPGVDITVDNNNICDGDNALFQILDPTPNTTYQWIRDGVAITGATQTSYIAPSIGGVYRVVGLTNKGCADTSRGITLTINPNATVDINEVEMANFCIGDTVDLSVEAQLGYEYYWSPEKSFRYTTGARQPVVKGVLFEAENNIEVMAVNDYGCKAYDQVTILATPCCDVYVPTAFSPNGDGLNDYFNILLQPGQKVVSFQIFDRSGGMVYDNNDVNEGWNGLVLNTGDEVAQAVYFYRIVYSCTDGRNYESKGDITVVR